MFEEIIGQEKVKEILVQAIKKSQVSHSYIFTGPQGTQKSEMAHNLAKALFCTQDNPPCHHCVPCEKMQENNHPDLVEIFPQGLHLRIQQIRELRQNISIKPYESSYKIYIIHNADTMGTAAQNALLKTLEEPPSYAVIILLTTNLQGLLPTIISRSQVLQFNRIAQQQIEKYLMEQKGMDEDKAKEIAILSNGSIGKAIESIDQEGLFTERQELLQYLLKIIRGDMVCAFSTAVWLKDRKEQINEWLDFLILWFRDITLYRELGDNPWVVHREYKELLKEFSTYLSDEQIHAIIEEIDNSKNNLKANVNLQLNMEAMLLKMQEE
ncbi:DNA polymerase III subunit delta' [Irregularibacter muris]|uniref:DNA polymerase III subunit delta' n=1 Tax=Irregularibacter muris TaxID=1796619 RepID=A0AAE3L096_9FIRM|nr:DNA polymerase III subunit delta' [Irregularibacter muris]MCR1899537.1 DNA polymerase III subunit delta' [Irregularibacter muris]